MPAQVVAVHVSGVHEFSKQAVERIMLDEGLGVRGDAHYGVTVQHRSRVAQDPSQPNLRQVHLIPVEVLEELGRAGYDVAPGDLGENITTRGIALLDLAVGTRLTIAGATVTVMGLRNPCRQIEDFRPGLLKRLVHTTDDGRVERLAGVMGVVSRGGTVADGDPIEVEPPPGPAMPLTRV
ncbi:MOSC domain-containing protein [Allobranchiibius sp. GilTou38]|uniref:MOSC domain-containing protein n=1 Tax=Allobranchiibius sp. GilTou38 TaxID=2815210 RepID=UPI001AA1BDB7|nr:MOSC domain-containing protein [Allobranchiibius sp. GilTou38]MBO1767650.1 MOSC domain-containing protein [Allobranchiibius sp. GilTou38]